MDLTLLAPVLIGLAASLHCIGMCGGIIGALSLSLPPEVRANKPLLLTYTLSYSLGRIASYALAGALVSSVGQGLFGTLSPTYGHTLLRVFAALLLIGMGFYLAGWFSRFAQVEKIGVPLWRRIEPIGQRLLPVRSPLRAMAFGLIWGWLPCGLVYSTLLWSAAAGAPLKGALYMTAFGLGTIPSVLTAGLLAGWVARLPRIPAARKLIGLSLILFGLGSLWFAPEEHAGHASGTGPNDSGHVHIHDHQ